MKNFYCLFLPIFILCLLFNENTYSQSKTFYNLFTFSEDKSPLNIPNLQNLLKDQVLLTINETELKEIHQNKYPEISLRIPYNENNFAIINLERLEILSNDAKIIAKTTKGNEEMVLDDVSVSYTGSMEGVENTLVVLNFTQNSVVGLMSTESENYVLGNLKNISGEKTETYVLYKESDIKINNPFNCGTGDMISSEAVEKMKKDILEKMKDAAPTDLLVANIAIDVDNITYNNFGGSISSTTNYIVALMSAVSAIYMKELNVKLTVSYLRIWTTPDPYTGSNSLEVLNNFVNEWNANQGSVPRTLAHLISTRSANLGGIAYIDVLCDNLYGYAFSNTHASISPLPEYSWDVEVVAHETGHNFGSNHTHSCNWVGGPIDTCWRPEGGCYNTGPLKPKVGTIMSYCHINATISFIQGFGPQPKALLRSRSESAFCMDVSSRPVVVGYPNGSEILRKGKTIQIYWGTSLTGNLNIELTTNNGSSWQTIQNNVSAIQRILNWVIPDVALTSQAKIRILNSSNVNVGDTSNSAFTIQNYLIPFNITIGIQGFWNGITQVSDTVRFYLRNNSAPYNIVDSSVAIMNSSGNAIAGVSNTAGGNFYIQVKHRNALETWSSTPRNFTIGLTTTYNFTTSQAQAFGNNQTLKSSRWCFYSGDVNQDGVIDGTDLLRTDNDAAGFASGYLATDENGDNFVDGTDLLIVDNNAALFVTVIRP